MLLLIGLAIGLILGLTGAGGSVFAVPLLMLLAGTPMLEATGIALGAVAAASLFGSLRNRASGMILWVPGLLLAATGMLSAPIGKWLALQTPPQVLILSFNALAVLIALRMGYSAAVNPEQAQVVRASVHPPVAPGGALCNEPPTCNGSVDCVGLRTCEAATSLCRDPALACQNDLGCPPGQRCTAGTCENIAGCVADGDCGQGFRCVAGACQARANCAANADCVPGDVCDL
ncbi:MAG TPA: TSUP family transporter, partial [Cellvibrionaceae bacterium]|nr:TSUP family transporter [Cellvibrionaceae bacterium]